VSERFLLNARWSLFRYIMARTRYIQWHGVEVRFVLDQRVSLSEKLHEANVILIKIGALTGVIVYQYW
jgi:hypothetical protein